MDKVKAFDSAYPGSMFEGANGDYIRRDDHVSLAASLVELIASRDRDAEDLRETIKHISSLLEDSNLANPCDTPQQTKTYTSIRDFLVKGYI